MKVDSTNATDIIRQFSASLLKLKNKADDLNNRGEANAGAVANTLHQNLKLALDEFSSENGQNINIKEKMTIFRQKCNEALTKEVQDELNKYRGVKKRFGSLFKTETGKIIDEILQLIKGQDYLSKMPDEVITAIGKHLKPKEQSAPAKTARMYNAPLDQRFIPKLLDLVAKGEQDKAQWILKRYPELLFKEGSVTDPAGRVFNNISPFQYAVWALDRDMWEMVLDCLPESPKGDGIRSQLLSQYNELMNAGVGYTLPKYYGLILGAPPENEPDILADNLYLEDHGPTIRYTVDVEKVRYQGEITKSELDIPEGALTAKQLPNIKAALLQITSGIGQTPSFVPRHDNGYDFALVAELKKYVDNFDRRDWPMRDLHWCRGVGAKQREATAAVAAEYCVDGRSFVPIPDFNKKLSLRTLQYYNWRRGVAEDWFSSLGRLRDDILGVDFGISRADYGGTRSDGCQIVAADADFTAVAALCEARTVNVSRDLRTQLQNRTQVPDAGPAPNL